MENVMEPEVLLDEPMIELEGNIKYLFADNWYKENPDKILGKPYEASGRFGKVTKYAGDMSVLDRIDVDEYFIGANKALNDPLASVTNSMNISAELQKPEVKEIIIDAIKKSNKELESIRKKKQQRVEEDAVVTPIGEINSFKNIFKALNPEISKEEIEVYTWHKSYIGKPLSKNYVALFKDDFFADDEELRDTYVYRVPDHIITGWIERGLLFYYKGELLPDYEYLSGDMYDKKMQLTHEKDDIVAKYGQDVYDRQVLALQNAYRMVYDKRLVLGGENSLVILANSKLAKTFMVQRIMDIPEDKNFKIKEVSAASDDNYGKPDFINDYKVVSYKKKDFEELSLSDAFSWWVLNSRPALKEPITHLDIVKYYVMLSPIRVVASDDTYEAKKAAEAKKEKLKSSTQREGQRLFGEFLETQLLPNDKIRLETQWNVDYNNHLPVNLNKVPVAFTMAKYIMGVPEVIPQPKRDAVAFTINNGTGVLAYDVGVGKGHLLTSNILTPNGYIKMGDIKVGDFVIGKDGRKTKVLGVFPLGRVQCYKVTFSDGSFTEVSDEHLWDVQTINYRAKYPHKWDTVRTMDIKDNLFNYRGDYQYSIPMVDPVHFEEKKLSLHPYLIGALLGDGCLSSGSILFSNPEIDIQEKVKSLLPIGVEMKEKNDNLDFRLSSKSGQPNELLESIQALGLYGTKSNSKFIPSSYLFNSIDNRLELLRGLLDTDGYITDSGTVQYTTVSEKLSEDVTLLVQSFGGTVIKNSKLPTFSHLGESKTGQKAYTLSIRLPKGIIPVSSIKQTAKFIEKSKYQPARFIQSITDIGFAEAQCIRVENPNGLYVCEDFIVTHNTPSAIYTISAFMDAGYCKHPLIVVPNQVYKQFITEIKQFTPHIPVIEGYNLSKEYIENFKDAEGNIVPPPSGAITIITYEGFENIAFNESTQQSILNSLYDILNQGGEDEKSEKNKASFFERIEKLVGRGLQGSVYSIEDFGFDFICYDEAHKMKKVFTSVKGETDDKGKRGKNPYAITSGSPSSIGLKGFMINYYILKNNGYKNILLLTATPFTNSPLEIFSMLSMVAYEQLQKTNLNNLKTFFDTYVQASTELVINSKLKPEFKQVILGFNNLISLQSLIRRFILYKTGEEVNIIRPKKYVLPYLKDIENGIVIDLPVDKRVETYISMTEQQSAMMEDIIRYVEDGTRIGSYKGDDTDDVVAVDEEDVIDITSGVEVDESSLSDDEKRGVRTIKGLSYSRNLALSPYLYAYSGLGKPDYLSYIRTSPKLSYVVECIRSVRDYCLSKNEPIAGQVIYMDRGIEYFGLIKEYLIKEVGYKEHEIGIIRSGLPKNGRTSKEYIKNLFNGEIYNDKTKQAENVSDNDRIKVVIGSSTIKEGINLQKYGAVLYNCFIDWNPTDIQQLEGRIYRQKNTFAAVRIVNPLVVDSADIFLFQKLQEKTARLNTIWATDGRTNVLHTEEFNPEELKYALIRNPKVIAELRIIEQKAKLESEILGFDRQIEIADRVANAAYYVTQYINKVEESLKGYRNFNPTGDTLQDATKLIQLVNDAAKNSKDAEGRKIIASWKRRYEKIDEEDLANLSPIDSEYSKPYYFDSFAVGTRDLNRYMNDFINQYKIPFSIDSYQESLNQFKNGVNAKKAEITERIALLESKEYKEQMVQEAYEEKERQKIEYKPLPQIISEFSRLNYLLSEKVVKENKEIKIYTSCPPMSEDGSFDISESAIKFLENCLSKQPQTKDLYYNGQEYLPERKILHEKIINELFKSVRCVKNDKPIAVFTGGSPASGKSSFLNKNSDYLLSKEIFHLDADEIRAMLPEYEGWNANSTHLETQDIVNELLSMIGSETCRYDLIYDGTMNKAKKYFELIRKVKNLGYETYIIFMVVPYSEAKKRALGRYKKHGRFVPMEVIDDFFTLLSNGKTKGEDALDQLKPLVDGWVVADGVTGNIIDRGGKGIPSSRSRSVYGKPLLEVKETKSLPALVEKLAEKPSKEVTKGLIKALNLSVKYVSGSEKETIQKRIKALELSLKYS